MKNTMAGEGPNKKLKLYDFQTEGIERAVQSLLHSTIDNRPTRAFLLCDEMGLGKTIQAFEIIKCLLQTCPGTVLIVAPASSLEVWTQNEYYVNAFRMTTDLSMMDPNADIVVTSYDMLRNAYKNYIADKLDTGQLTNDELIRFCRNNQKNVEPLLSLSGDMLRRELLSLSCSVHVKAGSRAHVFGNFMKKHWSVVIFDEVHKARNKVNDLTRAIAFVSASYRIGLSGTPIVNYGSDLLCIWQYALNLYFLNYAELQRNPNSPYCQLIIDTISLGRKKADIAELKDVLPKRDRNQETVVIPWTSDTEQRLAYVAVKNDSISALHNYQAVKQYTNETAKAFNARRLTVQVRNPRSG